MKPFHSPSHTPHGSSSLIRPVASLFFLIAVSCIFSARLAGELLVYEPFDYRPGSMDGRNGGIGWAGPYEAFGDRVAGSIISPSTDEDFGSGNYARFSRDSYHFRSIDTLGLPSGHINDRGTVGVPGTSLWISLFIQAESPILPPFFGISFFEDGDERLFLGRGNSETAGWKIQTEDQNALNGGYTKLTWIVLKIDFNNDGSPEAELDRVLMFLNPDSAGPEPSSTEAVGEIQRTVGPISFNRVRFVGNGNGFRINDFRIGSSFASISSASESGTVVSTR